MSSEGSVTSTGSQIRQFGLYRTIDARTEDFLRSSRKRQIKQGCACAAISTAITVTVVVSVILVYEYSINSDAIITKKNSINPHWIGVMNDSDITSIGSKFHKKINFDRTTLKLLPILLKALNKNRYIEKILDEYSGSSTPNLGKDTTEATFTRNIFSNSKNWLKLPNTRHFTLDYKTTPLTYWKNPTKRLEYLTKIRKIRDYQRMLNYFDKMVNERVGQKKEFDYTENPLAVVTAPMRINDKVTKFYGFEDFIKKRDSKTNEGMTSCICPKKLGLLLSKLIASLQDVVPLILKNNFGLLTACGNKTKLNENQNPLTTIQKMPRTKQRSNFSSSFTMSLFGKPVLKEKLNLTMNSQKDIPTTGEYCPKKNNFDEISSTSNSMVTKTAHSHETITTTATESFVTEQSTGTTNDEFRVKSIKNSIVLPLKQNLKTSNHQTYETTSDYDQLVKPTESPYFVQTTESSEVKGRTTETIETVKFPAKSYSEEWLKGYSGHKNVPLYNDENYDEDNNNKHSKTDTEFENIDVHTVESLKGKAMNSREEEPFGYKQSDLDLSSMRKMADMIYIPQEKNIKVWKYTIEPELPVPSHRKYKNSILQAKFKVTKAGEDPTTTPISSSTQKNIVKVENSTVNVKTNSRKPTPIPHSLGNDQPIDTGGDDELQEEYGIRPTESASYKYTKSTKEKKPNRQWDASKNEEKTATIRNFLSMLPSMRPIYLEIQRNNEWRQDDHGDYDIYNFNHNLLDLPN